MSWLPTSVKWSFQPYFENRIHQSITEKAKKKFKRFSCFSYYEELKHIEKAEEAPGINRTLCLVPDQFLPTCCFAMGRILRPHLGVSERKCHNILECLPWTWKGGTGTHATNLQSLAAFSFRQLRPFLQFSPLDMIRSPPTTSIFRTKKNLSI